MEVTRIGEGLWRWVTGHPDWKPGDDWERDVGCVYWEADDAVVLIDPLVPTEEPQHDRFVEALDRDVRRHGLPLVVLLTCPWHRRSADELAERYEGRVIEPPADEALPGATVAVRAPCADEDVFWLPAARAVVPGDVLLGTDRGVTLCPASWIQSPGGLAQLARELAPMLDLPVERVLTSHGPPMLEGGRDAIARAIAGYG